MSKRKKKKKHKHSHPNQQNTTGTNELHKVFEIKANQNLPIEKSKGKTQNTPIEDMSFAEIIKKKRKQRKNWFIIIASTLTALISAGLIFYFVYYGNVKPFAEEKITLKIDGPQKISTGEEAEYKISYANTGDISIKNAKLIFKEPHGLIITKTEPQTETHSWDLGEIKPGQHGETLIRGTIIDAFELEQQMTATLLFTPENFNSEFSIEAHYYTALQPLKLGYTINAPSSINLGEKVTINFILENTSANWLKKIKLLLITPTDFTIQSADPATTLNNNEWLITDFEPNEKLTFKLEGHFPESLTFNSNEERKKEFKLQTYYPNADDIFFIQEEQTINLQIVDQPLVAYLIVNGSTEDKTIELGDKLMISIIYKNKGVEDIANLAVSAIINPQSPDIIDWDKINDKAFGKIEKTLTGKKITWTKQQIPKLAKLFSNEEGVIDFTLPLKTYEKLNDSRAALLGKNAIEILAQIAILNESGAATTLISSSKIYINLNTSVRLNNRAVYYYDDGTPIGTGPLPPKAGETTRFVVFWDISNTLHEIENIKVSAVLPDKVNWTNNFNVSAGEVSFNPVSRELIWKINRLPYDANNPNLTFHLEIKPTKDDVGKIIKILNNATLTAVDTVTQAPLTQTTGILTTNLDEDSFGSGQGVVIE